MQKDREKGAHGAYGIRHRADKLLDRGPLEVAGNKKDARRNSFRDRLPELLKGSEVRKIRTRSRLGYTGAVPMTRIGRKVVSGESLLELDFLLVVDDVVGDLADVVAQPMSFRLPLGRKGSTWIPDFLVVHHEGPSELVEVKTEKTLHPADVDRHTAIRARVEAMRAAANGAGYRFRLATEREIRVQPRLANARLVHHLMNPFLKTHDLRVGAAALADLPDAADVAAFAARLPPHLRPLALMLAINLERGRMLAFDRTRPIGPSASFRIRRNYR
ncbi:TnsA endonuclease N-terminal domain-containing protein [Antarcticirhabdus aurantiaca]|uniref:Uncharacterized protein n=1 Tax=Antarcticirhabdus aurantiaca TaxID=2606717 RepID=A0ACD4NIR8_9HYPH|nr:hypothetical protein OXU80_17825 [Jeongeuplla avenae]